MENEEKNKVEKADTDLKPTENKLDENSKLVDNLIQQNEELRKMVYEVQKDTSAIKKETELEKYRRLGDGYF